MLDRLMIRVAVLSRYLLDCEGLVSLLNSDSRFAVVATVTDLREAVGRLRPMRPLVAIIDVRMGHGRAFKTGQRLLNQSAAKFILFVDGEPNRHRAELALAVDHSGYLTSGQGYTEIRQGIISLTRGKRPVDPVVMEWIRQSANSRERRIRRLDPPATSNLTIREQDVLRLLAEGNTVEQCANIMSIMPSTADNHKSSLMRKMGTRRTVELVRLAIREGVIEA